MTEDNFVPDLLEVDRYRLDSEWCSQPRLYHELADQLEVAQDELKYSELRLEVAEAEIGLEVRRKDPEDFGVKSLTEDAVKKLVTSDPRRVKAKKEVLEVEKQVAGLKVKVRTAEHRKTALEALVQLKLKDYIAEPRLPRDIGGPLPKKITRKR